MFIPMVFVSLLAVSLPDMYACQSTPWSQEDGGTIANKISRISLPPNTCTDNDICTSNVLPTIRDIVNAKVPGNSFISSNCLCLSAPGVPGNPPSCDCSYNHNTAQGVHQIYQESVYRGGDGKLTAKFRILPGM